MVGRSEVLRLTPPKAPPHPPLGQAFGAAILVERLSGFLGGGVSQWNYQCRNWLKGNAFSIADVQQQIVPIKRGCAF